LRERYRNCTFLTDKAVSHFDNGINAAELETEKHKRGSNMRSGIAKLFVLLLTTTVSVPDLKMGPDAASPGYANGIQNNTFVMESITPAGLSLKSPRTFGYGIWKNICQSAKAIFGPDEGKESTAPASKSNTPLVVTMFSLPAIPCAGRI
jgi:hypothetical protein